MNPGTLNKKLTIAELQLIENETGGYADEPQPVEKFRVWGNIKPLSGRRYWEAQSDNAKITHEVRVRFNREITRELIVIYQDRELVIEHVINVEEANKELILHCYERQ